MSNSRVVTAVLGETPYVVTLSDGTHEWLADEPVEAGGGGSGPSPHQLVLSGLGACTAITLRMYATRKGWALSGVTGCTPGRGCGHRRLEIAAGSPCRRSDEQRERLLQVANACPVARALGGRSAPRQRWCDLGSRASLTREIEYVGEQKVPQRAHATERRLVGHRPCFGR